jgi:hypothetical protein
VGIGESQCYKARQNVYEAIDAERDYQDAKWGGCDFDDTQTEADWQKYLKEYSQAEGRGEGRDFRTRMIKTAALAVAALESLNRKDRPK